MAGVPGRSASIAWFRSSPCSKAARPYPSDVARFLGLAWPGEALKLLWPLARAGILRPVRSEGRVGFYLLR